MGTLLVHLLVGTRVLLLVTGMLLLVTGLGLGVTMGGLVLVSDATHLLVALAVLGGGGLLLGLLVVVLVVHVGLFGLCGSGSGGEEWMFS